MTLFELLKQTMEHIKAEHTDGNRVLLVSSAGEKFLLTLSDINAADRRIVRLLLTREEMLWLSDQVTRIYKTEI